MNGERIDVIEKASREWERDQAAFQSATLRHGTNHAVPNPGTRGEFIDARLRRFEDERADENRDLIIYQDIDRYLDLFRGEPGPTARSDDG